MTNVARIKQEVKDSVLLYAVEKFNEYGVIQGYDESQDYKTIAKELQKEFKFMGVYLKKRFESPTHTQLLAGIEASADYIVIENDLKFEIRFDEHIDIGLFLDHRISRELIGKQSEGKDVLNLFAYTGSFSVYAAKNRAKSVTTVDLSKGYIDWAKKNFELNNLSTDSPNEFWAMDTFEFIDMAKKTNTKYDIIILDPPSFSRNSESTFQVQRDHMDLIRTLQNKLLRKFGLLFFSTNLQTFKLDDYIRPGADKLTKQTIPDEFKPLKPHQSYVFYN